MKKLIYLLVALITLVNCKAYPETYSKTANSQKVSSTAFISSKEIIEKIDNNSANIKRLMSTTSNQSDVINDILNTQQQIFAEIEKVKNHVGYTENNSNDNASISFPEDYPPEILTDTIDWTTQLYTAPSPSDPVHGYLVPFYQDGIKVTRVGDQTAFGETNNRVQHGYSSNQCWNADETLIKLSHPNARILNAVTGAVEYVASAPSYSQWSNLQPTKMYGTQNSNEFVIFDVTTNVRTVLHTFTNYTNISIGSGEGRLSGDDRYVCFTADRSSATWLISYDVLTDTVIAELQLPSGDLDFATISESGNYIICSWRPDGSGTNEGFKVYDRDLTNLRHLSDYTGHGDCGFDTDGDEVFVQFGNTPQWTANGYIEMIQLSNGLSTPLYYDPITPTPYGIWGGHISCRNVNLPGWAFISEGDIENDVVQNEAFMLKLSKTETNRIRRLTKFHADQFNYNHEAHLSVNRSGTAWLVKSNWNSTTLESWSYSPSYLFEIQNN